MVIRFSLKRSFHFPCSVWSDFAVSFQIFFFITREMNYQILYPIIDQVLFSVKEGKKSLFYVGNHRAWEIIESEPSSIWMNFWFKIFWHPSPIIEEKKCIFPITVYIVGIDHNNSNNISFFYTDASFFLEFTFCSTKYIFIFFFFPSRKSPIIWPITWIFRSLYQKKVWSMAKYDRGRFNEGHESNNAV